MHEVFIDKEVLGKPIPEWDLAHRLPIDRPVGPDVADLGCVYRVNSTYMDVTEPSQFERPWFMVAIFMAFCGACMGPFIFWLTQIGYSGPDDDDLLSSTLLAIAVSSFFGYLIFKTGRDFIFSLLRRPIRFHRGQKKLYWLRRRRFFAKPGQGDMVWEALWNKESIFCIHRQQTPQGVVYYIRHYETDTNGNVTQAFSIGDGWSDDEEVANLLAQWNYWCHYMSAGPKDLAHPMIYLSENETPSEAFFYAFYGMELRDSPIARIIFFPFILLHALLRILANATCRNPVWPEEIERISKIAPDDPYSQPSGNTPVGWKQTVQAKQRGEFPSDSMHKTPNWKGNPDTQANLQQWLMDKPPKHLIQS